MVRTANGPRSFDEIWNGIDSKRLFSCRVDGSCYEFGLAMLSQSGLENQQWTQSSDFFGREIDRVYLSPT
jgi:hypothetical protein